MPPKQAPVPSNAAEHSLAPKNTIEKPKPKLKLKTTAQLVVQLQKMQEKATATTDNHPTTSSVRRSFTTRASSQNLLKNLGRKSVFGTAEEMGVLTNPMQAAVATTNAKDKLKGLAIVLDFDHTLTYYRGSSDTSQRIDGHTGGFTHDEYEILAKNGLMKLNANDTRKKAAETLKKDPELVLKDGTLEYLHLLVKSGITIMFATVGNVNNIKQFLAESYYKKFHEELPELNTHVFGRQTQLDTTNQQTLIASQKQLDQEMGEILNTKKRNLYTAITQQCKQKGIETHQIIVLDDDHKNLDTASDMSMVIPGITQETPDIAPYSVASSIKQNDIFVNATHNMLTPDALLAASKHQGQFVMDQSNHRNNAYVNK